MLLLMLTVMAVVTPSEARGMSEAWGQSTVMDAMHDELVRSMMELRLDGLSTPYHIEYTLTKRSRVAAHAILGIVDDIDTGRANAAVGEFLGGLATGHRRVY